jgi:hypothetical protein
MTECPESQADLRNSISALIFFGDCSLSLASIVLGG